MTSQSKEKWDSYFDIDRMINEGLGGGLIHSNYHEKQMDLNDQKQEEKTDKNNIQKEPK